MCIFSKEKFDKFQNVDMQITQLFFSYYQKSYGGVFYFALLCLCWQDSPEFGRNRRILEKLHSHNSQPDQGVTGQMHIYTQKDWT